MPQGIAEYAGSLIAHLNMKAWPAHLIPVHLFPVATKIDGHRIDGSGLDHHTCNPETIRLMRYDG